MFIKNIKNEIKDAVICLAAGKAQEQLIIKAKSLGHVVIAIDRNPKSLGFKYADMAICQSTYDAEVVINELEKLEDRYRWIGILNRSSGPPVITAAKISKYFNLPGVPIESARNLVNKDKLRESCLNYNIPSPTYKIYSTDDCENVFCNNFPIVVKPALSLIGKSGISVVRSKEKLKKSVDYAKKNTINGKIILEEFLEGPDIVLVSFVTGGDLCSICILDELNNEKKDGSIVGRGFKTHSSDKNDWIFQANKIAKEIISNFKIECSPLMISFRANSHNVLKLMEVHLDLGGDLLIEGVFEKALPFNFLELAVKMALGKTNCPENFKIKPTAIFYDEGDDLVTNRNYTIFTGNSNESLEEKILKINK